VFDAYSAKQWDEIKREVGRVGVDADTVMVGETPLHDELDRLAAQYIEHSQRKIPTTKQLQQVIDDAIDEIASLRSTFGPRTVATYYVGDVLAAKAQKVLKQLEAELQSTVVTEGRDHPDIAQQGHGLVLKAPPGSNAANPARQAYWTKLMAIWEKAIAPRAHRPYRRKDLINFMMACTGASASAIGNYLDRLPPHR
jgi:hypothetical protein